MNNTDDLPAARQYMNMLFDFYGSLLTKKQADCFTMRYVHDYSLTEIAEEMESSPQAVVDFLKRAVGSLERYEEHLGLVKKFQERKSLFEDIFSGLDELARDTLSTSAAESVKQVLSKFDELMLI